MYERISWASKLPPEVTDEEFQKLHLRYKGNYRKKTIDTTESREEQIGPTFLSDGVQTPDEPSSTN